MNQQDGFYRIDTERNDNPYRITNPIIAVIGMAVLVALFGGWL